MVGAGTHEAMLDVSGLPSGVYLCEIVLGTDGAQRQPLIVLR